MLSCYPNPYRLIIDIHGKNDNTNARRRPPRNVDVKGASAATADVEAPPKASHAKVSNQSEASKRLTCGRFGRK